MSKKPKLQDTLEVFYNKLDSVESSIHNFSKVMPEEIQRLKEHKVTVNLSAINEWGNAFFSQMDNRLSKYKSIVESNEVQLHDMNLVLDKITGERKKYNKTLFIITGASIGIALLFVSLFTMTQMHLKEVKLERHTLEEHNIHMFEFIREIKGEEEFGKWLDAMESLQEK